LENAVSYIAIKGLIIFELGRIDGFHMYLASLAFILL